MTTLHERRKELPEPPPGYSLIGYADKDGEEDIRAVPHDQALPILQLDLKIMEYVRCNRM